MDRLVRRCSRPFVRGMVHLRYQLLCLCWSMGKFTPLAFVLCMCTALTIPNQDLLMDWSLLRPHAPYPLLRHELLYNNAIPVSV